MYNKFIKNNEKFNNDLKYGIFYEWENINVIKDLFNNNLIEKNQKICFLQDNISKDIKELKRWDLCFELFDIQTNTFIKKLYFEIKSDAFSINTGNWVFERTYKKQPSGVFATHAEYFLYCMPLYNKDNVYIMRSSKLVEIKCCFNFYW
jgi:hypothetical protein